MHFVLLTPPKKVVLKDLGVAKLKIFKILVALVMQLVTLIQNCNSAQWSVL